MRLALQTDYALRTLLYLATGSGRATVAEVAEFYGISAHHLGKVVQQLGRLGLVRNVRGPGGGIDLARPAASITVGEVRTSPDLKVATVYVLPLGGHNAAATLEALNRARSEIRRALARAVELRHSPELRFVLDESYDRMDRTREMLSDARVRRDLEADD